MILLILICATKIIDQSLQKAENESKNEFEAVPPTSTPKPTRARPSGRRGGKPDPKSSPKESTGNCHGSLCGKDEIL